jgi:hypothetical protein
MLSKQKLKKVEAILESYLALFESQKDSKHNTSVVPLAYASGLNLLIKDSAFHEIINKENRIKNAKIVRAAKTLIPQFENFGVESYTKFTNSILTDIKSLNGESKLTPNITSTIACVDGKFLSYALECSAFYDNLLVDIFNTGRQHQTVANPNAQVTFRKFASYEQPESESYETITAHLKNELYAYLEYFKDRAIADIEKCVVKNYNKTQVLNYMYKKFSKHSYNIQEIFRKHSWQVYSFGNIYQLEKDNVRQITWKTGQHIDDCITCRAFQTGEEILKDGDGNDLPHTLTNDAAIYNINDIIKIAKLDGPAFFCHDGCRCEFISAESKKATF